ncbi:MAG: UDP-N-acetylmuramoyl-tripeptide--D-alanyl-D-alanine ligase [Acidimicrobiales bacterium]
MIIPLADVVERTGGRLHGDGPVSVRGASIDSRAVAPGQLFVAVVAERDGHEFVADAVRMGASAVLVSRPVDAEVAQVVVDDTVDALGRIGALARERLQGPVVGITGSVGKTSTKDLLAAVCASVGVTTASEKSLNNEMGVPLTLVNADESTVRTVVEMGARGIGHIAALCAIARPTVGIVTAVAAAHTEMFGSLDGVALAKGELVEALPADGTAVLNVDDERVAAMASRCAGSVVGYGERGEVRAVDVVVGDDLRPSFVIESPWGSAPVRLDIRGAHNVGNALAAAAAALVTGIALDDVVAGLGLAHLSPSRMDLVVLDGGGVVIDDAYNANPSSMRAALAALARVDARRRVAVLGCMAELGPDAGAEHLAIAAEAAAAGIEVVAVGTDLYGIEPVPDVDALLATVPPPSAGEATLLKGSRVAGLDRVARQWRREGRPTR